MLNLVTENKYLGSLDEEVLDKNGNQLRIKLEGIRTVLSRDRVNSRSAPPSPSRAVRARPTVFSSSTDKTVTGKIYYVEV